jgi:hypothetical protein
VAVVADAADVPLATSRCLVIGDELTDRPENFSIAFVVEREALHGGVTTIVVLVDTDAPADGGYAEPAVAVAPAEVVEPPAEPGP